MLRSTYYAAVSGLTGITGFHGTEPMAAVLASVRYAFNGGSNPVYLAHLSRAFPDLGTRDLERILRGFWRVHQRAFLGLFTARRLGPGSLAGRVEWSGREELDAALAEGRGVVLAVPHFGDERTLHILLAIAGYPMHVISSRYAEASTFVRRARLGVSMRWHHVGFPDENPAWIFRALRAGEVVQIAPTAWGGPKGHWVRMFGVPVLASSTPMRLAGSTGCAVVTACNHALPGARYRIVLRRFRPGSTGREGTEELFAGFQRLGEEFPEQYNWMNLVIRHRETNTIARLGRIPADEREVEAAAIREDLDPAVVSDYSVVSRIGGASR